MGKSAKKKARDQHQDPKQQEINSRILIDFSIPTCWCSVKNGNFTNYLKDSDSFLEYQYKIFFDLLPRISECSFSDLYCSMGKHCHVISDQDKIEKIRDLFIMMYSEVKDIDRKSAFDYYNQNFIDQKLYQIGDKGAIRLIGVKDGYHHFKLLFIDYYHLVFPSKKHNEKDLENYSMSLHKKGC